GPSFAASSPICWFSSSVFLVSFGSTSSNWSPSLTRSQEPAGLVVQEAPEKRPQAATCQQSFVKLGLMAYPSGCQNPPAKMAARGSVTKTGGVGGGGARPSTVA